MYAFANYVVGKEQAVAIHLALCFIVYVCHQNDACKNNVGSVYVIYGDDVCCSVVFGTLVGVSVLYYGSECQRVECVFTSPMRSECGMFVMCCMQCCMSVSTVL